MKKGTNLKIQTIDALTEILSDLRKKKKRIVHCHGVFDLLHPGHLKHFEAAKQKGDILLVTITKDEYVNKGPGRPIFNQQLRAESIAALECVDFVAINEWPSAVETIRRLRPHLYVKGSDYSKKEDDVTGKICEEEEAVKSVGGAIHFTDEISFSSSSLINTHLSPLPDETRAFLSEFKKRYTYNDIISSFKKIENLNILVIGDIIIDEYHYCVGMGKSQKDNIIATRFINDETFSGGVLASVNHLAGFCKNVTLISCIGKANDYGGFIAKNLKENIKTKFFAVEGVPTVVKRRFVEPEFLVKLFEICYLNQTNFLPEKVEKQICQYLDSNLSKFDMVMVNDFGHGLITDKIVKLLVKKAKFLAVNVQTNSANLGFNIVTKFPRADFVCIDEGEMRLACHDRISDLERLVRKVSNVLKCNNIIVTRGFRGSLGYSKEEKFVPVPVFSKEVIDRVGAGDAYFSITSPFAYKKYPMEVIEFIGNTVGAMKVLIVGNRASIEPVPYFKYISTILK